MTFATRAARLLSRLTAEALRLRALGLDAKARAVEAMAADVAAWLALDALAVTVRLRMTAASAGVGRAARRGRDRQ